MMIKKDDALLAAKERLKVGLVFSAQSDPSILSRQFVIFIKKNGMAFENIMISAIFDN